jgi:hypothetical protein
MKKLFVIVAIVSLLFTGNVMAQSATADAQADAQADLGGVTINNEAPAIGAGAFATEEGDITNINRNFPYPGGTVLPQTNGFFTAPTPDSSFRNIKEILNTMSIHAEQDTLLLSEDALRDLAAKGGVKAHKQTFRGPKQVKRVKWSGLRKLYITIKEPEGAIPVTMLDGEAKNGTTNTLHVIGRMGLLAIKDGCTHMVFNLQGAHRKVEASGWGIGLHSNAAAVSESGKVAGIGGGGLGYSRNVTGPEDRPWLHAVGVVDPDVVASEAAKTEALKLEAKNNRKSYGHRKSIP